MDRKPWQNNGPHRAPFGADRREEFGVRSGPRARALETRRFSERSDFAKSAIVKLDADLADYFDSAEAVNKALRMVVQLAQIAKKPTPAKVEEKTTEATEVAAEEAEVTEDAVADVADEAMFSEDDFEEQMPQADVEAEDKKAELVLLKKSLALTRLVKPRTLVGIRGFSFGALS